MASVEGKKELELVVRSADGIVLTKFDFGTLGINVVFADAFMRALAAEYGHTSLESQKQSWRCIRKLVAYMQESGLADDVPLPASIADDFKGWLADSGLRSSTAQSALNVVLGILAWCRRNVDGVINPRARLVVRGFSREEVLPRRKLGEDEVKAILAACYEEIEQVEGLLAVGRRYRSADQRDDGDAVLFKLIDELLGVGGGDLPTQRVLHRSGNALPRRVAKAGGLRTLSRLLWLTPEGMFPFYLAIVVQTSGNPMAIAALERACVRPHPLREDVERLTWEKKRSRRDQWAEFPTDKEWSATSLVRRIGALNADLEARNRARDQGKLFICRKPSREVSLPCFQMFHMMLDSFIRRHQLQSFDFKDLRRAGATAHHKAAGNIAAAQDRLNHVSLATTRRYTDLNDRSQHHDQVIGKFQGELVRLSTSGAKNSKTKGMALPAPAASKQASTVFGFDCRDPYAGLMPGTRPGVLCTQFQRCATCPGAIIPLDDIGVVAKLLAAAKVLDDARQRACREGWRARYDAQYESTRRILEEEILIAVDPAIRAKASLLVSAQPIPWLE